MTAPRVLLLVVLALAGACRGSEPAIAQGSAPTADRAGTARPAADATRTPLVERAREGTIAIEAADGSRSLGLVHRGRDVEVAIHAASSTRTLVGEEKDTGKRKYAGRGGAVEFEVRPSDAGFKLRTPSAALLWKVKIDDDKIKVSDNEDNRRPWVLKTGYDDKVKVLDPGGVEIGEVRFHRDRQVVTVRDAAGRERFTSHTARYSAAFGVLLMRDLPPDHQAIVMAELIARGR
jgi:hypothetical protein